MSFGQNFAYSKTKEEDIGLMLTANVCLSIYLMLLGSSRHWELLWSYGPIHVQAQPGRCSHHQPRQVLGKAHGRCKNHRCHPQPQGYLGKHHYHIMASLDDFARYWLEPFLFPTIIIYFRYLNWRFVLYRSSQTESTLKELSSSSRPTQRPTTWVESGPQVLLPIRTPRSMYWIAIFICNI